MTDSQILILGFIFSWTSIILLTLTSKRRIVVLTISLTIHLIYSSYLLHGLFYDSEGGSGLVWWFYLLVLLAGQTLISIVLAIRNFLRPVTAPQ